MSPGYWWFVVIFALGRPLLSATNAIAQVCAAEVLTFIDRAKAVTLVAAGYGVGTGLTAVIHGLSKSTLGFRGLFTLSAVPLLAIFVIRRRLEETGRFTAEHAKGGGPHLFIGAIPPDTGGAWPRWCRSRSPWAS